MILLTLCFLQELTQCSPIILVAFLDTVSWIIAIHTKLKLHQLLCGWLPFQKHQKQCTSALLVTVNQLKVIRHFNNSLATLSASPVTRSYLFMFGSMLYTPTQTPTQNKIYFKLNKLDTALALLFSWLVLFILFVVVVDCFSQYKDILKKK